jgi:hypothetical protein
MQRVGRSSAKAVSCPFSSPFSLYSFDYRCGRARKRRTRELISYPSSSISFPFPSKGNLVAQALLRPISTLSIPSAPASTSTSSAAPTETARILSSSDDDNDDDDDAQSTTPSHQTTLSPLLPLLEPSTSVPSASPELLANLYSLLGAAGRSCPAGSKERGAFRAVVEGVTDAVQEREKEGKVEEARAKAREVLE